MQYELPFGPPARTSDPVTSHLGAADVIGRAGNQRHRLLATYLIGPATDATAAERAGLLATRSCWWKRCSELRQFGAIEPTGEIERDPETGSQRIVCEITMWGRLMLEAVK